MKFMKVWAKVVERYSAKQIFLYCYGVETVSALVLSDIEIFRSGILKSQIEFLINEELKPPQSYFGVKENTNWPIF
jgi:hypothetical protein